MTWSQIIEGAEITFGFVNGSGLGAVLLTAIIIVYLLRNKISPRTLIDLVKAFRPRKDP